MRVATTNIPGVLLIEPDVFRDPRGLFLETYHARRYADAGIPGPFVQDNYSQSLRGHAACVGFTIKNRTPRGNS